MRLSNLFIIFLCLASLISCSKKSSAPPQINGKVMPGIWELRASLGGMAPYDPNNYKPGNGNLWGFSKIGFTRIYKDSVYRSGIYSISIGTGTDLNTGNKIDQFVFNDILSESFKLKDDTLRFYYGPISADGTIQLYVKISDDTALVGH